MTMRFVQSRSYRVGSVSGGTRPQSESFGKGTVKGTAGLVHFHFTGNKNGLYYVPVHRVQ
jgi:hypothetical protein